MKTLLWKELRQLAPWGALLWLAAVLTTIGVMAEEFDGTRDARMFANDLFALLAFGSAGVALVLGFLQTGLEVRRDQWAFLLHRGLSATQVFLAKVGAGMLVYAAVVLTSAMIIVGWARGTGVERYPFSWYQTLPLLAGIAVAPAFYFAAMLTVVWKGPWYVSRVLPLAAPCLMFIGVVAIVLEATEYVPFFIFAAIVLGVIILGVAAQGAFVRSGESAGRPRWGTVCLAIPLFAAIACAVIAAVGVTTMIYEWALHDVFGHDRWSNIVHMGYAANREGHILRLVYGPGPKENPWNWQVLSVTDLDRPNENRYAALVGKSAMDLNKLDTISVWDPLPTSSVWYRYDHPLGGMLGRGGRTAVLEDLGQTDIDNTSITWIYSSADGWIYGYVNEFEVRDGRRRQKPPRLTHVVGPDGFTDPAHRPARRFGRLLACSASYFRGYTWAAWPELVQGVSHPVHECYLLCDDGLHIVNLATREVRPVLAARDGRRIRNLVSFDEGVAVVYDDAVSVYTAKTVPFGAARNYATGIDEQRMLKLPDELRYSFPLPEAVTRFERFDMAILLEQKSVLFRAMGISSLGSHTRFITMKLDGTGLSVRDFPNDDRLPPETLPPMCATAPFVPVGPLALAIGWDTVSEISAVTSSGRLWGMLRQCSAEIILLLAAVLAGALFSRWSAGRTARRYGFDPTTRRTWQWTAFLLGPIGLLTLWLLRDWPAMEKCAVCANRRPVDRDTCPHCAQPAPRPMPYGTEIIVRESSAPVGVLSS